MKIRPWLVVLAPPALAALLFGLLAASGSLGMRMLWLTNSVPACLLTACIGGAAGLAASLCAWAQGNRGFHVNAGALGAGAVLIAFAAAAAALGAGLTADSTGWVFTEVSLALPAFGGVLMTGACTFGGEGGRIVSFRWRQSVLLLLTGLGAYAAGAVMNAAYHIMPHSFSFDNFPPHPGPDFLAMQTVRYAHVMVLLAAAPLALPVSLPDGRVKNIMRAYGFLLSAAAIIMIVGYGAMMLPVIAAAPFFGPLPESPLSAPFRLLFDFSPAMMNAVFLLTGMCLRLGFSRSQSRKIEEPPGPKDPDGSYNEMKRTVSL